MATAAPTRSSSSPTTGGRPVIEPQPGPQSAFLSSPADIAVYGGAAGGGKTWALLLEPLRHVSNPHFTPVIFRRTYQQVMAGGGLLDESRKLYPAARGVERASDLTWHFPGGCTFHFGHLQHEKNVIDHLGAQYAFVGFDQLEQFTPKQFWGLVGRNRSTCGVTPYVRATANPDVGSFVADLIDWWIDELGYPRPERAGVLRWFVRGADDRITWADTPDELRGPGREPKSFTFVPATVEDNKILMAADPGYVANLQALPLIERERLLRGNWRISAADGEWPPEYFGPSVWFDHWLPESEYVLTVIGLDPSRGRDSKAGDYAAYVVARLDRQGVVWLDAVLVREDVPRLVARGCELARQYPGCELVCETNIGQELLVGEFKRAMLAAGVMFPVSGYENRVPKVVRIRRLGPYLAHGRIRLRATPGGKLLGAQLQGFPNTGIHDDGPDAAELAIRRLEELVSGRR